MENNEISPHSAVQGNPGFHTLEKNTRALHLASQRAIYESQHLSDMP